jgi:hypothetical protein
MRVVARPTESIAKTPARLSSLSVRRVFASAILAGGGIVVAATVVTATPPKTVCAVYVNQDGNDAIGQRIALAVKERLTASPWFRVEENQAAAVFRIYMPTVGLELSGIKGEASAVSVTFTLTRVSSPGELEYLTSSVGVWGAARIKEAADSVVAGLERSTAGTRDVFCR